MNSITDGDPIGWREAFLVLAVRRCRQFVPDMGVPQAMVIHLEPLHGIARFVAEADTVAFALNDDEYARRMVEARHEAFRHMRGAYPAYAVEALAKWARRYFVDEDQRATWWRWGIMLPELAGVWGQGRPFAPSPLPSARLERFNRAVLSQFQPTIDDQIDARLEQARTMSLDGDEQRWVTTIPIGGPEDLVDVSLTIGNEQAYRVWRDLASWLTEGEQAAVLAWARAVAEPSIHGIRPESLHLPGF